LIQTFLDQCSHPDFASDLPEALLVDPHIGDEGAGLNVHDDVIDVAAQKASCFTLYPLPSWQLSYRLRRNPELLGHGRPKLCAGRGDACVTLRPDQHARLPLASGRLL
jgi:hypothetical protein